MIGARLKEERERLGMAQPVFAESAGAAKRTLIDWEKGVSSPTAVQLSALAQVGVDLLYVLTGQRSVPIPAADLTREEKALVDNYRHADEEGREAARRVLSSLAQSKRKRA